MKYITLLVSILFVLVLSSFIKAYKPSDNLLPAIHTYLKDAEKDFKTIPVDRKAELQRIADYIDTCFKKQQKVDLIFICTHNSRRSQMGQLWALAAADYYGIKGVNCYSGGTETTAFNERVVKALRNAGFVINPKTTTTNPVYIVQFANNIPSIACFSKKYSDSTNPATNFAAIMTCSQADKNCPFVKGASTRIAIHYEDPKASDGKPDESEVYQQRCKQIATEMLYAFSFVKLGNN